MSKSKILLSIVTSALVGTVASAMEFQVLGARAASMGGAGIATSPSSLAAHNNPALLANNSEKFGLHIGAGVGVKDNGAGTAIGDLNKLDFSGLSDAANGNANNLSVNDINTLAQARNIIVGMNGAGIQANPTADVGLSFGSFGTGLFITSDIGGMAHIDQTHTDLIFETSLPGTYLNILTNTTTNLAGYQASSLQYAIDNGRTYIDVVGLAIAEIPLAYGHAFDTGYGSLAVGAALKLMSGKTFYKSIKLDDNNAFKNLNQSVKDTSAFGVDLGLAYKPLFSDSLTVALVGKNLNKPSFDVQGGGKIELDPMVRAGTAYKLGNRVEFALDADLTENKSITGHKTRYVGGGLNFDLSLIELSAGLMKNMVSENNTGVIYTAGIATGPSWLHFALSGQMASKTGEIDGNSYPKQASINFAISSAW